jgi:hypothetical protein
MSIHERCIQGFVGKLDGIYHLKDLVVSGRIILKWILAKHNGEERGLG